MEANSDRGDFTAKHSYVMLSSASAWNSPLLKRSAPSDSSDATGTDKDEYQPYKKSTRYTVRGNLTDVENSDGHVMVLKDRYLLSVNSSTNNSNNSVGNNGMEYYCVDVENNEKYLCKIITESYDKVTRAYFQCSQDHNTSDTSSSNLESPIRPVKDVIPFSDDRTYLLMEQKHFGNLHTYLRDCRRLTETDARFLFRQICETVQTCHRNGIVLRDLKLKKFFFRDSSKTSLEYESLEGCVILDDPADDSLNEKIGCPVYVAPELITSTSSYNGKPADMWALGVILYTLITGRYPFNDLDGQSVFTKILSGQVSIPQVFSSRVKCLLRSLLRKEPEMRITIDDIFFHPWFSEDADERHEAEIKPYKTEEEEQCVPDSWVESDENCEGYELT